MIIKVRYSWLFLCGVILCAANASGWAVARKLAGIVAGAEFLYFSTTVSIAILCIQGSIFFLARNRLMFYLLFRGATGLALVWYLLCLALPVFWISEFNLSIKGFLLLVIVILFISNWIEGFGKLKDAWRKKILNFDDYYDAHSATLDWDNIVQSLRVSVSFHIPGLPKYLESIISVLLVLSMVIGLIFRKAFPLFSIGAWGIPCIVFASMLLQMIAINIALASEVYALERILEVKIKSMKIAEK